MNQMPLFRPFLVSTKITLDTLPATHSFSGYWSPRHTTVRYLYNVLLKEKLVQVFLLF